MTKMPFKNTLIAFRVPQDFLDRMDAHCEIEEFTRSQFIRRCVNEKLKSSAQKLAQS